jgi:voltage-gated potassium channel
MKFTRRIAPRTDVRPYDLFMFAVTILSLVNLSLYLFIRDDSLLIAVGSIDVILSGLFLIDFLRLFFRAPKRATYFFKQFGWADLLASMPFPQFKILRVFRLVKAYGLIKRAGWKNIRQSFSNDRAATAIFIVLFIIILLLEFGSVGILAIEGDDPNANIHTASDALWWVYVTITTVGYGDTYPVTNAGRVLGAFVMLVGVGLFGVVTGFLANKFLPSSDGEKSESVAVNKDASLRQLNQEVRELRELIEKKLK